MVFLAFSGPIYKLVARERASLGNMCGLAVIVVHLAVLVSVNVVEVGSVVCFQNENHLRVPTKW